MTKQLEYGVTHRNTFTLSYTIVVHSQCGAVDCTQHTSGVSWTSSKPWSCSQRLSAARVCISCLFIPVCTLAVFPKLQKSLGLAHRERLAAARVWNYFLFLLLVIVCMLRLSTYTRAESAYTILTTSVGLRYWSRCADGYHQSVKSCSQPPLSFLVRA